MRGLQPRWIILGVILVLALGSLIGVGAVMQRTGTEVTSTGQAAIGGPFRLTDQNGQRVAAKDFQGQWMLVYFGYTYCPDICPTTLATMTAALDELPPDLAEQVVPVFITVDPERDTVEQLEEYAPLFSDRLVALTGTDAEVKAAARAYKVYFSKAPGSGTGEDYAVDHSGFVYFMGPNGTYQTHFSHDTPADEMASRMRELMQTVS